MSASKHAIAGFVRAAWTPGPGGHGGEAGIRVAALAHGSIETPLYTDSPEKLAILDNPSDVWIETEEVAESMISLVERDAPSANTRLKG